MDQLKFNSLDEVQEMIRRLKTFEAIYQTNGSNSDNQSPDSNSSNGLNMETKVDDPSRVLEAHELFDYEKLCDEPNDIWLVPDNAKSRYMSVRLDDTSWIDDNLINSRNKFLSFFNSLIKDRTQSINSTPTSTPVKVQRNSSYSVRNGPMNILSPISPVSSNFNPSPCNNTLYYTANQSNFEENSTTYNTNSHATNSYTTFKYPETPNSIDNRHSRVIRKDTFTPERSRISVAENLERLMNNQSAPTNLNTTFTRSASEAESNNSGSSTSLNNSSAMDMDDIESMAKIQEQSLNNIVSTHPAPIQRRTTRVLESRDYVEHARQYNRTSSNDTYSVGDSNPTSATSSVISSPSEFQSCEDIQSASDAMRRSMPNLTFMKSNRNQSTVDKSSGLTKSPKYYSSDLKIDKSKNQNTRSIKPGDQNSTSDVRHRGEKEKPRLTRGNTFNKPIESTGDALNNVPVYNDGDEANKYRYNTIVKQSHPSRGSIPQFSSTEGISVPKYATGTYTRKTHPSNDSYHPTTGSNTTFSKPSSGMRTSQTTGSRIPGPGSMNSRLRPHHDSGMSKRDQQDWRDGVF